MTKLITIDYDEYLELIRIKCQNKVQFYTELRNELLKMSNMFCGNFSYRSEDIHRIFDGLLSSLDIKIKQLEKEGENNE